jgi:hypothetical protein
MSKEPLDIGAFRVVSASILLIDPHCEYSPENDQQLLFENVAKGRWLTLVTFVEEGPKQGQLETFTALHIKHVDQDLQWEFDPRPVKTQSGFLGIFDKDRHQIIQTPYNWSLHPHAFVHRTQTGEGFFDVSVATHNDRTVGFEVFLNKLDDLDY